MINVKLLLSVTGLLVLLLSSACQSAHEPGGTSHAVKQIQGRSLEEIQKTTAEVFGAEGYTERGRNPEMMVFDRAGSRRDAAKYGGWSGEGVTMRVRVGFTGLAGGNYRLQADATAVEDAGDPLFEDESRAMTLNRRPYQNLLDEVAKRLK
jgi:hypothetical protein